VVEGLDALEYDAFELAPPARIDNGIPVTANTIAGMREGETGWLNAACDPAGLAAIMQQVIERPQIVQRNATRRRKRDPIVLTISRQTAEMEAIYREAMDGICRAA
jgi:hypothetical protein